MQLNVHAYGSLNGRRIDVNDFSWNDADPRIDRGDLPDEDVLDLGLRNSYLGFQATGFRQLGDGRSCCDEICCNTPVTPPRIFSSFTWRFFISRFARS